MRRYTRTMKLAFLAGANSIHSVRWIKFFADRGHDITWISLSPPIPEAAELARRVHFHEVAPSPLADVNGPLSFLHIFPAVKKVRNILAHANPDVLHIHSAGTYGLVGALAKFHPTVLTPWGSDILLTSTLKLPLVRSIVRRADAYTCDGENTRAKLIELGADPSRISLVRFGTDMEKFSVNKGRVSSSGASREVRIISLRSLEPTYDIETMLRAASLVVTQRPEARFLIVGDGSMRNELERLAEHLGLMASGAVVFLGRIENNKLPDLLCSTDIYVSTSRSDSGLASSTAEAMACGLPVVVTDSGDNREWVEEGKGGFVVPCGNPKALAEKISYLIAHPEARGVFGAVNRARIERDNNYAREMEKVEKIYEKIIESGQTNRE